MGRARSWSRPRRWLVVAASALLVVAASPPTHRVGRSPAPVGDHRTPARSVGAVPRWPAVGAWPPVRSRDPVLRRRLVEAADRALHIDVRPRDPLAISRTDDPFVRDARAAWTLALAGRVTGRTRYREAAAGIVDAWATVRRTRGTCPSSGSCSTSLMVSRAAPALVLAVAVLRGDGAYGGRRLDRFHRWLREVALPAASDRANNWGDAGTLLRAVVALELQDRSGFDEAVRRWRGRMDLMERDGRIPEEMRRGHASLMYSQEALSYRVLTAEVFSWAGVRVWDERGRRGGTMAAGLDLVARGIEDPGGWPGRGSGRLRVPDPGSMWALVAARWPTPRFERLASRARALEGGGHSAVVWLAVTHGR